jgi:16S rRNA (adenine1518-N6/adenine1519-N6)-dimethyltransferase
VGRRLGQHFLRDESALRRIAQAACPAREPLVIEIGPGEGALTRHLAERARRLIAIELDADFAAQLQLPGVEVVHGDILAADLAHWGECVVAGNLPYYITSPIVEKILELGVLCRRAVLLVQKEVAERLAAAPGSRDYGYLTVSVQSRANVEVLFGVPRGAFRPPPKVDSAVVRLTPHADAPPKPFLDFAGKCFRLKRKTLRNNLAANYPRIAGHAAAGLRAEQLSIAELRALYDALVS